MRFTYARWEEFLCDQGLGVVKVDDFSERRGDMRQAMIKELGMGGMVRMAWKLLQQPDITRELLEWDRIFKGGKDTAIANRRRTAHRPHLMDHKPALRPDGW